MTTDASRIWRPTANAATQPLYEHERRFQAMQNAGPELHKALYDLLHALHPASQRVAAANAREILAKVEAASR